MRYYAKEKNTKFGSGLLNSAINRLPFELHLPGYNYCGPGTKLDKRLNRGDKGVNLLDEACKEHDIAYSKNKELPGRHMADNILLKKSLSRMNASDASWKEKLAALGVSGAMHTKLKLGMGSSGGINRRVTKITKKLPYKTNQSLKVRSKCNTTTCKKGSHLMKRSVKTMEVFLENMKNLVKQMDNMMLGTSNSSNGKTKKSFKPKKNQSDNKENHFDNYHEKKIKEKMNMPKAASNRPVRKRKLETEDEINYSEETPSKIKKSIEKEIEMEIGNVSEKSPRKRKLNSVENEENLDFILPKKMKSDA